MRGIGGCASPDCAHEREQQRERHDRSQDEARKRLGAEAAGEALGHLLEAEGEGEEQPPRR